METLKDAIFVSYYPYNRSHIAVCLVDESTL